MDREKFRQAVQRLPLVEEQSFFIHTIGTNKYRCLGKRKFCILDKYNLLHLFGMDGKVHTVVDLDMVISVSMEKPV